MMRRRGSRHHERLNRHRWEAVRLQVLKRDEYRCSHCGKHGRMEVHHVLPLDEGGAAYALANLESWCRGCHVQWHLERSYPMAAAWRRAVKEMMGAPPHTRG